MSTEEYADTTVVVQPPHKKQKHFACGTDIGFGYSKIYIEHYGLLRIPSYISEVCLDDVDGKVEYQDKTYTIGETAYLSDKHYHQNVENANSKIEYALIMLLGALSHLEHRKEWHLHIVTSIHDADNLQATLIEKLNGTHVCKLKGKESTVTIDVLKVMPEGMAALYGQTIPKRLSLIDFGTGTTLFSRYLNGKRVYHEALSCGCHELIELIVKKFKASTQKLEVSKHLIREGLESGKLNYGRSESFKAVYKEAMTEWYEKYLRNVTKKAKETYEEGDTVWCIGGGCLLPGFTQILQKAGFVVHDSPVDANVTGLFKIAQAAMKKGA